MNNVDFLTGLVLPNFNFLLFLVLCVVFFRKPLAQIAAKRRADFESAIKEATKAKDVALQKNQELTQRLRALDTEVAELRNSIIKAAEQDAARVKAEADALARNMIEEARRMADAEVEKARLSLKTEILETVHDAVVNKIKSELRPQDHVNMIEAKMDNLQSLRV